jgi:hypothetical protein
MGVLSTNGLMREQLSSRREVATDIGQEFMKVMIREPVKQAVQEALAEQGVLDEEDIQYKMEDESDDDGGILSLKTMVPLIASIGIALAVRRLGEGSLDWNRPSDMIGHGGDQQTRATEQTTTTSSTGENVSDSSSTRTIGSTSDEEMP